MNEVKRALMFWPAFASALIILISLVTPMGSESWEEIGERAKFRLRGLADSDDIALKAPRQRSRASEPAMRTQVPPQIGALLKKSMSEPVARIEDDENALQIASEPSPATSQMRMDEQSQRALLGPTLNPAQTILQPPRDVSSQVNDLAANVLDGDILAAERIASKDAIAADQALGTKMLQSVPKETPTIVVQTTPAERVAELTPINPSVEAKTTLPSEDVFDKLFEPVPEPSMPEGITKAEAKPNQPSFDEQAILDIEAIFGESPAVPINEKTMSKPPLQLEQPVQESIVAEIPKRKSASTFEPPVIEEPIINEPALEMEVPESILPRSIQVLSKPLPRVESVASKSDNEAKVSALVEQPAQEVSDVAPEPKPISIAKPSRNVERTAESRIEKTAKPKPESEPRAPLQGNPAAWPVTTRLFQQLDSLAMAAEKTQTQNRFRSNSQAEMSLQTWVNNVGGRLQELQRLSRLGEPKAGKLIYELGLLAQRGSQSAESMTNRPLQIEWLRAAHAVQRRVAVWQPVHRTISDSSGWVSDTSSPTKQHIQRAINRVAADLPETGDAKGWGDYLLLSEIDDAIDQQAGVRAVVARKLLSRLDRTDMHTAHRQWLQRDSIYDLQRAVRPWLNNVVDYASLLNQIERQESDAIDLAAIEIADTSQSLKYVENPQVRKIASAIDTYYRNANIRSAISEELIQRLIPEVAPSSVPHRSTMLGSRVRGISHVNSDLEIALQPAANRWSFTLQTRGNIQTQSTGLRGRASISTRGNSAFIAATPIQITPDGTILGQSSTNVRGSTRLRGIRTQFDSWPLFGSVFRSIAESEYQEVAGVTSRIANRKMQNQIGTEIDKRLNTKVSKMSDSMTNMIMGPLGTLRLAPTVVDMQTTEERLIARYRLAGDYQLGAFTPRPRAPSDSLISLQINQSALNNTLERVVPKNEPTTIQAAINKTLDLFGVEQTEMPDDIPTDVLIQFTKTRPITVEFADGQVWVTLRIVELSRAKGGKLSRFIVRAAYQPQVDGLNAKLVRDGHLRVSGPGMSMRERLPIRAIFNKVLSPNRTIPITMPALAEHKALASSMVSQLEVRDGWMALAISDHPSRPNQTEENRIAEEPVNSLRSVR